VRTLTFRDNAVGIYKEGVVRPVSGFRWVLVALSGALAALLIVRGNIVVGALVGAMAVTRALMFVRMHHRRAQLHERLIARREEYRARAGARARFQ
jgi:hypothetical protein